MDITFRIRRYNPESGGKAKPFWQEFELKDVAETNRVLEMLHRVKWEQDGTLSFRRSFAGQMPCVSMVAICWRAKFWCAMWCVGQKIRFK
jgi:succinate dehydrogenase/fumarate reductase-like Fe-S protein